MQHTKFCRAFTPTSLDDPLVLLLYCFRVALPGLGWSQRWWCANMFCKGVYVSLPTRYPQGRVHIIFCFVFLFIQTHFLLPHFSLLYVILMCKFTWFVLFFFLYPCKRVCALCSTLILCVPRLCLCVQSGKTLACY
ncbi:uncharacterized protein V1518DRAFT_179270 [Limtongia smithiae]|uniref:uncharacterized protein n=1 Tax=Limtongia smithiae TaxID=1125753 RepID=UPI0034CE44BD